MFTEYNEVIECRRRNLNIEKLKSLLNLVPLPSEGGCYAETYRSTELIKQESLPSRYSGPRNMSTAIYYLLEPNTFSALHRVASDEIFHFYIGDPVEMLQLWPDGSGKLVLIGADIEEGHGSSGCGATGSVAGLKACRGRKVRAIGLYRQPRIRVC